MEMLSGFASLIARSRTIRQVDSRSSDLAALVSDLAMTVSSLPASMSVVFFVLW
jgi:hypothetical protein